MKLSSEIERYFSNNEIEVESKLLDPKLLTGGLIDFSFTARKSQLQSASDVMLNSINYRTIAD